MHKEEMIESGPEMRNIGGSSSSLSAAMTTHGAPMSGTAGGEIRWPRCEPTVSHEAWLII